ncbi:MULTISPECIES: hypothetical protein [unclassified Mycobacterium]|uniref:hypothetical protein n=1 Tax=unclassified Mycobacterium TaxID=2642494 RepID=UPI0029C8CC72|nr:MULTISPECIES: hypothetical protein [unclassified Mycobacterium]
MTDPVANFAKAAAVIGQVAILRAAAPRPHPCEEPAVIECPRGCGFVTGAKPSLRWGPWRMQVHLLNPTCPRPILGGTQNTYRKGGYVPPFSR